jgi:uncharacterized protein (TIGR03083 family)
MQSTDELAVIEYEAWRIIEWGRQGPDRVVPQYPSWTLRDLVIHVAGVHGRTGTVCETLAAQRVPLASMPQDADPFDWAAEQLERMLHGLATADPGASVWTFVADPALRFWQRRMLIETGVHRWDAQSAASEPDPLLDVVARHGLDEFSQLYLPRLADVPTLELYATDLGHRWCLGPGRPEAVVSGNASDLFLRLMSRPGAALPRSWEQAVDALGSPADRDAQAR